MTARPTPSVGGTAAEVHTADGHPAGTDQVAPGAADADRRVLRRAVGAGLAVFVVLSVTLGLATIPFGGGGAAALVWVCSAAVVGALVTAGWLVLVLLLDMAAGHLPSRRRAVWTAVAFLIAFVSPVLPAAAFRAASGG